VQGAYLAGLPGERRNLGRERNGSFEMATPHNQTFGYLAN